MSLNIRWEPCKHKAKFLASMTHTDTELYNALASISDSNNIFDETHLQKLIGLAALDPAVDELINAIRDYKKIRFWSEC